MHPTSASQPLLNRETLNLFLELHSHLDSNSLRTIVNEDLTELRQLAEQLMAAFECCDCESACRHAHSITGLAATFGMHRLSYLADEIVQSCRDGVFAGKEDLSGLFRKTMEDSLEELLSHLN